MQREQADHGVMGRRRVLLVDDDELLRRCASEVLGAAGIDVVEAGDGSAALDAARSQAFDAVLLDVRLPGADGLATCRALRRACSDPDLPIFMLTGLGDQDTIDEAYRAGATDFATKPPNWTVLVKRLLGLIRQRELADHLGASEQHRRVLLEAFPDTIVLLGADGLVLETKLSTQHPADWPLRVGRTLFEQLPPDAVEATRAALAAVARGERPDDVLFTVDTADGRRHCEARLVPTGDAGGDVLLMLRDMSERYAAEAEIRRLAYHDPLTGLPNRSRLRERLDELVGVAVDSGAHVAVLRIDLAGLGHAPFPLGTERNEDLLIGCAQRLQRAVAQAPLVLGRGVEAVLGRTGDHGFAVLLGGLSDREAAERLGRHLLREMSGHCQLDRYEIEIEPQLGIAQFPDNDRSGEQLLDMAEMALRDAVCDGDRQLALYSDRTHKRALQRAAMVRDLKAAIDHGDLYLDYQPKVDAGDGSLRGVEALVRWRRGDTQVAPSEFIPLAEAHGLILPLGDLVLYNACRQVREWQHAGCGRIPVAVNFSAHQFNQRGLVRGLSDSLAIYGVAPDCVEVELTESVAIQNGERLRAVLAELGELGVSTAIDDFGTGFSSLSSLREFRFNTLKIDRSFVSDLRPDSSKVAILDAIIAMGHALGMKLVAEGVETLEQLAYLRDSGCDVIQGFFTGRPMSPAAIAERVAGVH